MAATGGRGHACFAGVRARTAQDFDLQRRAVVPAAAWLEVAEGSEGQTVAESSAFIFNVGVVGCIGACPSHAGRQRGHNKIPRPSARVMMDSELSEFQ